MDRPRLDRPMKEKAEAYTKRVLGKRGKAKKSLGQNFLIDDDVIANIVYQGIPEGDFPLVEIGPGLGGLTRQIITRGQRLWAVELDDQKIALLNREFSKDDLVLIHRDALQLQLQEIWGEEKGWLVGNLPYYISNPLMMHFLEQKQSLSGMTVMVQKEVADRILAKPGSKDYGILTIAVQISAEVVRLFDVLPDAFWPKPKVTSTVIRLDIRPHPDFDSDEKLFFKVVKAAFSQRRKTILNTLSAGLTISKDEIADMLGKLGINEKYRAENLSISDYQRITNYLH